MDRFLRETGNIGKTLTSADSGVVELFDVATILTEIAAEFSAKWHYRVAFYLENLVATIWLPTIPKAPFPDINLEDSTPQKITAVTQVEDNYAKIGMKILRKKGAGDWLQLARPILQNRGREIQIPLVAPFLTLNETKLLGATEKIGIEIYNAGYGLLGAGDYIQIEGDWRCDLTFIEKSRIPLNPQSFGVDVGVTPTLIRSANESRTGIYLSNATAEPIWLHFGDSAECVAGNCMKIVGTLNFDLDTRYLGQQLWGVVESGTGRITGMETSYA